MLRERKVELVESLRQVFNDSEVVVAASHSGLTAAQTDDVRKKTRAVGAGFKITKNRLAKIALAGTSYEPLSDLFKGSVAIVYAKDPVAAAKVAVEFAKGNEGFKIIGGSIKTARLDARAVDALAKLPPLDELRSKLIGLLQASSTKFVRTLQAPATNMVGVLAAKAKEAE